MKNICLNFRLHLGDHLSHYPFTLIGSHSPYFDKKKTLVLLKELVDKSIIPTNKLFTRLMEKFKNEFKISFSISGPTLELMEAHMTNLIKRFETYALRGQAEFTAEPYYPSLAALQSKHEFMKQVNMYEDKIFHLFGKRPKTFRNTELIHADFIGNMIYDLGYKYIMIESNERTLKGRTANKIYKSATNEKLRLLVRNRSLSEDITERFQSKSWSEWPLTADKYLTWLEQLPASDQLVNIWMDLKTLGHKYPIESGIMDFFYHFITKAIHNGWKFILPSTSPESVAESLSIQNPISIKDHSETTNIWLSNDIQQEAFYSLYQLEQQVINCGVPEIIQTWRELQSSDHFYFMNTQMLKNYQGMPYKSPFEAFINYMNILSDFKQLLKTVSKNKKKLAYIPEKKNLFKLL
ncbi:polysaccharide deacetylase family protein [Echinicola shivajiensis]|uniref:hypothetical protein n=1 Tax=Echinicola shivajiensis TaxID=1035916 RepID=UPI0021D433AE|nr:hypothetical protein [Echinicola shivajiensis]